VAIPDPNLTKDCSGPSLYSTQLFTALCDRNPSLLFSKQLNIAIQIKGTTCFLHDLPIVIQRISLVSYINAVGFFIDSSSIYPFCNTQVCTKSCNEHCFSFDLESIHGLFAVFLPPTCKVIKFIVDAAMAREIFQVGRNSLAEALLGCLYDVRTGVGEICRANMELCIYDHINTFTMLSMVGILMYDVVGRQDYWEFRIRWDYHDCE
jgi:hypothetical protein